MGCRQTGSQREERAKTYLSDGEFPGDWFGGICASDLNAQHSPAHSLREKEWSGGESLLGVDGGRPLICPRLPADSAADLQSRSSLFC